MQAPPPSDHHIELTPPSHPKDDQVVLFKAPSEEAVGHNESNPTAKRWVLARAVIGEFLVTFLFLFSVMAAGWNLKGDPSNLIAPIVTGFAGVGLIYSFADVSGAHFNPAVTFATLVTRKMSPVKASLFIAAQLVAAVFATVFLGVVFPDSLDDITEKLAITPVTTDSRWYPFAMEFILTYVLVLVIFSVVFDTIDTKNVDVLEKASQEGVGVHKVKAKYMTIYTTSGQTKAGFAPIAIGFTIGFLTLLGSRVSGGAFNPARVFGTALIGWKWDGFWVYLLGDLLGAAAGGWSQMGFAWLKHKAISYT